MRKALIWSSTLAFGLLFSLANAADNPKGDDTSQNRTGFTDANPATTGSGTHVVTGDEGTPNVTSGVDKVVKKAKKRSRAYKRKAEQSTARTKEPSSSR